MLSIIGAGKVGTSTALMCLLRGIDNKIVLVDVVPGLARGEALDLSHAASVLGIDIEILGSEDFSVIRGSDIVLVTAGKPRKAGMTREQLVTDNRSIINDIAPKIREYAPDSIVIITTNPLEAMTYLAYKKLGFPRERVIGFSGVLDSARLAYYASRKLNISHSSVIPVVIGMHGENMLPLPRFSTFCGIPLTQLLREEEIEAITKETIEAGATITKLKGFSSSYGPAAGLTVMVEAIKKDSNKLMIASVLLNGEYGEYDVVAEVPVILGKNGIKRVVELPLNEDEKRKFLSSIEYVKSLIKLLA